MHDALKPMDVASRIPRLRNSLELLDCDALIVTSLINIRYLTGFTGMNAMLVLSPDNALLCTDGRYALQSRQQLGAVDAPCDVLVGKGDTLKAGVQDAIGSAQRVGLEAAHVPWAQKQDLGRNWFPDRNLVPTVGAVEHLRAVKDAGEVDRIARAAALGDAALQVVLPMLATRPTEKDVVLALEYEMRRAGADAVWPAVVAAGVAAAEPHHVAGERRIEHGDAVVLDFGCLIDGYHSDMTRTHCVGPPSSALMIEMYEVIHNAQRQALDLIRPGVTGAEVSALARNVIAAHDPTWEQTMTHGAGHGIGLVVHETPIFNPLATDPFVAGQVLAMEPGVYLPGHGGVRIEDTVVVVEGGCVALTNAPKEFVI